jgi:hypothetical protein
LHQRLDLSSPPHGERSAILSIVYHPGSWGLGALNDGFGWNSRRDSLLAAAINPWNSRFQAKTVAD